MVVWWVAGRPFLTGAYLTALIGITYSDNHDLDIKIVEKNASPTEFNIAKKMIELFVEYSNNLHAPQDCSTCEYEKTKLMCPEITGEFCDKWTAVEKPNLTMRSNN